MSLAVRFDERIFLGQQRGGVSRYFAELAGQFATDPSLGVRLLDSRARVVNEHIVGTAPSSFRPAGPLARNARRVRGKLLPRRAYPPPRDGERADLVHYTYWETDWLVEGVPTVTTVHDMIVELMPELFPPSPRPTSKRAFVDASSGVVCVSETTRRDLVRVFGAPDVPTVVIPLGVGETFRVPRPASVALPPRYVVFVGQRGAYKNFDLALDAFSLLRAEHPDLQLLCIGGLPWSAAERQALGARGLDAAVRRMVVSDADLPAVYARARVLLFPSAYEGFGLPVLEAMAAGCPVVVADTDIAHEVAGGAAATAATLTGDGVAAAADGIVADGPARSAIVEAGRLRASGFTWERTARLTADFYRTVLAA